MKNIKILITIAVTLITTLSYTQEDEWSNQLVFNRLFKNGKMISDLETDENYKNVYGKISYLNKENQKILELTKFDSEKNQMISYATGSIKDLQIKTSFQKDSTFFIYEMNYKWNYKNENTGKTKQATVYEKQIMDLKINQIVTTIQCTFNKTKETFYAWGEQRKEPEFNQKGLSLPHFFKVKRISMAMGESSEVIDLENPESKINYALWTKDAFYRYADNGLKDKIVFSERTDSVNTTKYNTLISYTKSNGDPAIYMNNYDKEDYKTYVSTLDINPFPIHASDPVITLEQIIVWEKYDLISDIYNYYIKLNHIGSKGFNVKELNYMQKELDLLEGMIHDLVDR